MSKNKPKPLVKKSNDPKKESMFSNIRMCLGRFIGSNPPPPPQMELVEMDNRGKAPKRKFVPLPVTQKKLDMTMTGLHHMLNEAVHFGIRYKILRQEGDYYVFNMNSQISQTESFQTLSNTLLALQNSASENIEEAKEDEIEEDMPAPKRRRTRRRNW